MPIDVCGLDCASAVMHYVEQLNGEYTYQKTDDKTGTTEETLILDKLKDDDLIIDGGITYKEAKVNDETVTTAKILADGSLVIKLYYQRENRTLIFIPENGGENIIRTGKYESLVIPPEVTKPGYTFASWSPAVPATMPAEDASYTAQWMASTDTPYMVEHYWQDANGTGYTIHETTLHKGTTGQTVTAVSKSYPNFFLNEDAPEAVSKGTVAADGSLVLKLYYDREQFEITFDPNEGTLTGEETQSLRHGATVTTTAPVRTGYGFGGWYLDKDCTIAFNGIMPVNNITVYAKWTAGEVSYTVRHYVMDVNGYYPNIENPTSTDNETAITGTELVLEQLKDTDHEVENGIFYKEGKVGGSVVETATVLADSSLVVELYYERKTYTLTWDLNGGTQTAGGTAAGSVYYDAPLTVPVVSKTGYLHNGWIPAFEGRMPAQDVTYTALWNEAQYNITYKDVGGASFSGVHGSNYPTIHTYGAATELVSPTKANYNFMGWFTDINGSGVPVTALAAEHTGDVTLYARWSAMSYGITYYLNDGTNAAENPETYSYGTVVNLQNPTRIGYTFLGWYTNESLSTQVTNPAISATDSGNKTFYAKWEPTIYTITYQINVEGVTNKNPTSYTIETDTIDLKVGDKTYYRFDGWFTDPAYTEESRITRIEAGSTGNITIYGKLTEVGKLIDYFLGDGGVNHESNPSYYLLGQGEVNLQPPTREGYTFVSWTLQTSSGSTYYDTKKLNFSTYPTYIRLTANWNPNTITVTYYDMQSDDFDYYYLEPAGLKTTATVGEEKLLSLNIFPIEGTKHKGKQLLGFYTTPDCSGEPVTNLGIFKTDTTLYPKWADGTMENPYQIRNDIDLCYFKGIVCDPSVNAPGKYFKIVNTFTATQHTSADFYGHILESEYTITYEIPGMTSHNSLFKTIYGTVRNIMIMVEDDGNMSYISHPSGEDRSVGLLAKETAPNSLVTNCHLLSLKEEIQITFDSSSFNIHIGGLIGKHQGVIDDVSVNMDLSVKSGTFGAASIGGIAGTVTGGGVIRNATVTMHHHRQADDKDLYMGVLGGIAGKVLESATIENCIVRFYNPKTGGAFAGAYYDPDTKQLLPLEYYTNKSTRITGIIAGYISNNTGDTSSIKIANIRAVQYDENGRPNGVFPLAGILEYNPYNSLQYIYVSVENGAWVTTDNLVARSDSPAAMMTYLAKVTSADNFPTGSYYLMNVDKNYWEDGACVTNGNTYTKDRMNQWVNEKNATNPGKYKLWD